MKTRPGAVGRVRGGGMLRRVTEIGSRMGPFEILEVLGQGGMGKVYLAEDTRLGRKVALKTLAERRRNVQEARDRLRREARAASALNHPHICTLYDVGSEDGLLYIVMEYVEGRTLRRLTRAGGLRVDQVLSYGRAIADALAHAHRRGVLHRDLKPANVMVTPAGGVKVLDFGLAAFTLPESGGSELVEATLTLPGETVGTPHYISPEQLGGERADARSDLWALGIVLFEMATGRRPFRGKTAFEISTSVLRDPPAPLPATLPAGLAAVIHRCLRKEPARRYQEAREVLAALEVVEPASSASRQMPAPAAPAGEEDLSRSSAGSLAGRITSVAVLPLRNLARDPEQEYFSDGMTEALINDLSKIAALKVISRTSVMRYKGSDRPLPEIAAELGVDGVLEGSVLRSGGEVRINAQLVHADSDTSLWAESYGGDLKNLFRLQSEVAQAVADRIRVAVTPEEREQMAPGGAVKPKAHEAYLQARQGRNLISRDGYELSIDWARRAIEIDPDYARPYELLAEVFVLLGMYGFQRPRDVFPLAKRNATRALELDDGLADAHSTMGWAVQVHDFDCEASEREYRRALELNPNHEVTLMRYGAFLIGLGQPAEGLAMIERSVELDPMAPIMNALYAYALYLTRDFDGAIAHCHKMAEWEPDFWWTYWNLGEARVAQGGFADALKAHEKAFSLERNPFTGGGLGAAFARAGDPVRAEAMLKSMQAKAAERYVPPYFMALIELALGWREAALDSLEKAWEERDSWCSFAAVTPALDELRGEPRFRKLLEQMGLPQEAANTAGAAPAGPPPEA